VAIYCTHCGKKLEFGVLHYLVTVHVSADSDGVLPAGGDEADLESFMRSVDREESKEVEKDLHQSKAFELCSACKNDFMKNVEKPCANPAPDTTPEEGSGSDSGEGKVH
jgi:hypothetical protein